MSTLFISDLHLDQTRPNITALFIEFLHTHAPQHEQLYILGDLFEAWIGDDVIPDFANQVAMNIRALQQQGTRVFFIHGNRDFLLGHDYAARCGMEILPELCVIDLYGQPTLLLHGDTLCTEDTAYQAFRQKTRQASFQTAFLAQSPQERQRIALQARNSSASQQSQLKAHQREEFERITDVHQDSVNALFLEFGLHHMIHGHTHRPKVHVDQRDNQAYTRCVLGDWYEQGSVLTVSAQGMHLDKLPIVR